MDLLHLAGVRSGLRLPEEQGDRSAPRLRVVVRLCLLRRVATVADSPDRRHRVADRINNHFPLPAAGHSHRQEDHFRLRVQEDLSRRLRQAARSISPRQAVPLSSPRRHSRRLQAVLVRRQPDHFLLLRPV